MNPEKDIDKPMGNAELRLSLLSIENEIGDVKSIAMSTHEQAKKTNGRVNLHDKMLWTALGALPLLTIWAGWLTEIQLNRPAEVSTQQIQAAVQQAVENTLFVNK